MNDHPTISVITPSYNQGEFLFATIESVISQEGDFFIDYIIMDGGSTDNSVLIMQDYEGRLQRGDWPIACRGISFAWSSGNDNGQADAVNKGFTCARGDILGWLNSDDTYLPGALATAVMSFTACRETVMVYGNAWFTDRSGNFTVPYRSEPFSLKRLATKCIICQPAVFLRREILQSVGYLDANLHTCLDYEFWIRIGKAFESRIVFLDDYLATSRLYAENKTLSLRKLTYQETMQVARRHFGYVPGVWIVHSILEVIQSPATSPAWKIRTLAGRLIFLRYLLQPKTLLSVLLFSFSRLAKKEAATSWWNQLR
jgi:glycosyltransferase involved in cell wall biosynthesis